MQKLGEACLRSDERKRGPFMKRLRICRSRSPRLKARLIKLSCLTAFYLLSATVGAAQNPASPDGWVVLPVADYHALRQAAFPDAGEPEPPPVEATLTR